MPYAWMCSRTTPSRSRLFCEGPGMGPSWDRCLCLANTLTQTDTRNIKCINPVSSVTKLQVAVTLMKSKVAQQFLWLFEFTSRHEVLKLLHLLHQSGGSSRSRLRSGVFEAKAKAKPTDFCIHCVLEVEDSPQRFNLWP